VRKRSGKRARSSRKPKASRQRTEEEEEDESRNKTLPQPTKKASADTDTAAIDLNKVKHVGHELAQVLQGANIGKVEFHFNIYTK
jgi:hypothetical protein